MTNLPDRLKRYSKKAIADALDPDFADAVWEASNELVYIDRLEATNKVLPTIMPVRHAAWDYAMPVDGPERNRYRCSRCSGFALLDYWGNDVRSRYCPECGAIMDDEGKKYWVHYDGELTPAEE